LGNHHLKEYYDGNKWADIHTLVWNPEAQRYVEEWIRLRWGKSFKFPDNFYSFASELISSQVLNECPALTAALMPTANVMPACIHSLPYRDG
jgi:hypothetical protein